MGASEIMMGIGAILITLFIVLLLLDDYRKVRRQELAQREVRRRHDQYLADARERARQEED